MAFAIRICFFPVFVCAGCSAPAVDPIRDLAFEQNEQNTLSVWATWTTPEPATSAVRFGPAGEPAFEVSDSALVTEHRVLVYGLHEQEAYEGYAVSAPADGEPSTSEPVSFRAGDLPFAWLRGEVVQSDPDRMQPGWTLCNLVTGLIAPTVLVAVDAAGEPVWYHIDDWSAFPDVQLSLASDGIAYGPGVPAGEAPGIVSLAGDRAWDGPRQPDEFAGRMHHVFEVLPDDTFVTTVDEPSADGVADLIQIVDRDLAVTWEWSMGLHLDHAQYSSDEVWTGVNSVAVDLDEQVAYIHARQLDAVFAVSMADSSLLWEFGRNVGTIAADPDAEHPWFEGAHAVSVPEPGHILLYDNGESLDPDVPRRGFSRVVEYAIDLEHQQSSVVWEFPEPGSPDQWIADTWGDADRLENGNTLIGQGRLELGDHAEPPSPGGAVLEVNAEGEVVWELRWDLEAGVEGSYQVERIPDLLEHI